MNDRRRELAASIRKHVRSDGEFATAIPGVQISRRSQRGKPIHTAIQPCLALVAQGGKTIMLGSERLTYGEGDYLLVSLDLPIVSRVAIATAEEPNLGVGIAIDAARLSAVIARLDLEQLGLDPAAGRGVSVHRASPELLETWG
jgi:AraC-type transcriptional regulator N-terminus